MKQVKSIHQFVSTLSSYDAVSNSVMLCQRLLKKLGYESHIYVQHINRSVAVEQKHYETAIDVANEILLIHHCMGTNLEDWFANLKYLKLLIYHNITAAHFFKPNDSNYQNSILGRQQLRTFLPHMQGVIADSDYNA